MRDMTKGSVTKSMLLFAAPMALGNLLQQFYNVADTLIVGKFLGADALAAVGSSYTLMVFLTSIILGLCMGAGVLFSMLFGAGEREEMKQSFVISFGFIGTVSVVIEAAVIIFLEQIIKLLQIPAEITVLTYDYLNVIFIGLFFTFIYNFFASLLRAVGNSEAPLIFLAVSAVLNIILDVLFILKFNMGVGGAAWATVTAQAVSAVGIAAYFFKAMPELCPEKRHFKRSKVLFKRLCQYSLLTCVQQSVMNFGILMVQGLVNSFGVTVMAGFAAAVKVDSFAYMPVQDFGNAFSTFIAQNYGAGNKDRIKKGIKSAVICAVFFCAVISVLVVIFAEPLLHIFLNSSEIGAVAVGVQYLHIVGAFYFGIGCLFLLYGLYRGVGKPGMSVVLTIISLGTRVGLAYALAPHFGVTAIWWAIPIGWVLADAAGFGYYIVKGSR